MAAKKTIEIPALKAELVAATRMRLQAALLLLLLNVSELTDEEFEDEQPIPEAALPHRDAVLALVKRLDIALVPSSTVRDELLAEVAEKRRALAGDAKLLYTALDSMGIVTERIQDAFTAQGLTKLAEVSINKGELLRDCIQFLQTMSQAEAQLPYAQELLACFPFAIARERFYAYIREAFPKMLEGADITMAEDYLASRQYRLFPDSLPGYTETFPAFIGRVRAFANRDFSGLTEDELQEAHEDALTLSEDLEYAVESLKTLYESYQFLLMLLTFADDADSLLADDNVAKDAFHATVEALLNNEYEAYSDNLAEALEECVPKALDAANAAQASAVKHVQALGIKSIDADAELSALLRVKEAVDEMFFAELSCFDYWTTGETVSPEKAAAMTDAFLDGIKAMLSALSPKSQKTLRRELFTQVPCMMTPDELYAYLDAAYDAAPGFLQQALIVEKIGRLFERFDYNPPGKSLHEESHHHHHHGADCDCGHEHHHHAEDCDCGQTHHHAEDCDCEHEHHHHH